MSRMSQLFRSALLASCFAAGCLVRAGTPIPLPDPGFEHGAAGWSGLTDGMSAIVAEAKHEGEFGLRVTDRNSGKGSSVDTGRLPVTAGKTYSVAFWARAVESQCVAVYLQFYDAAAKMLNQPKFRNEISLTVPENQGKWKQFTLCGRAPQDAASVRVWIHSFNGSQGVVDLDDFSLTELSDEEAKKVATKPTSGKKRDFPIPRKERIAEIAALLPAEPKGLGDPIAVRATWDKLAALESAGKIIAKAEAEADEPPPDVPDELYLEFTQNGNRTNYQRPYGQRSGRIATFVKAECLENKGRFLPAIERDILAMCEERSWVMPAHDSGLTNFNGTKLYIDLGCGARAWLLAQADYWLGDKLKPETRARIRTEIRRRALDPYLETLRSGQTTSGWWWMRTTNNWNAVCNACTVGTALALVEDPIERAEFIAGAEVSNPYFLSGFAGDGYCTEGLGYWCYGFGHYMLLGETVWRATGGKLSFYDDERLPKIGQYAVGIQIQNGVAPAFADCGVGARPAMWILALIAKRFPAAVAAPKRWGDPLGSGLSSVGIMAFDDQLPEQAPPDVEIAPEPLPLRTWFDETGILITRSAPNAEVPFGAAFKGGHNAEHHNHNDVGSYTIVLNGKGYLLDPGGEVYTRRTFSSQRYVSKMLNSYGHPVPIVAGKLQPKGAQSRGKVLETEFSDALDRLVLDISSAYDVPELQRLVRTFEHHRAERKMVIRDEVAFSSPQDFGTALVTYEKVHRRAPDTLVVYDTERSLVVKIEVEGGTWELAEEQIENPGKKSPMRLGINMTAPVASASVCFTITPANLDRDLPGIYHAPDPEAFQPNLDKALTIEAEAMTYQTGGEVTVCEKLGASGKAFKFWDAEGHTLEWTCQVPAAGRYAILVRCCHASRDLVTRKVLIDGQQVGDSSRPMLFPETGGWSSKTDDWQNIWLAQSGNAATVDLPAGRHTLTMVNDCGIGLNLDWIKLVPVGK